MKPEQLEAIRKRSDKASGNWLADYLKMKNAQVVLGDDVPALLAEVEKLQAQLGELIDVVRDNCNRHSAPYTLAEAIEWGNENASEEIR